MDIRELKYGPLRRFIRERGPSFYQLQKIDACLRRSGVLSYKVRGQIINASIGASVGALEGYKDGLVGRGMKE